MRYATDNASLAAGAGLTVVSGGAKGVDRAAMDGALDGGGRVVGVLPGGLERAAVNREHRGLLMDERLVLVSGCDPGAGFNVGHAMARNKVIYALADATLVVEATEGRGGTWAGAEEQLRGRVGPVYVRSTLEPSAGLAALLERGAQPWPNPRSPEELGSLLESPPPDIAADRTDDAELAEEASANKSVSPQLEMFEQRET